MMIYDLLFTGPFDPQTLTEALADVLAVPIAEVDVATWSPASPRNWDALVLCTYAIRHGNVSATASFTVRDEVPSPPSEADLAELLAVHLGYPVIYPAVERDPTAYWLADGHDRPARIELRDTDDVDPDFILENEDEPSYTITVADRPVPAMPGLRVAPITDVLREHRMPTPLADAIADRSALAVGEDLWYAQGKLSAWEQFVARMAAGWPPDGWFPADLYAEYLECRDEIDQYAAKLEPELAARLADAVRTVDEAYTSQTIDDGGTALATELATPVTEIAGRGPRWRRRPERLPWQRVH